MTIAGSSNRPNRRGKRRFPQNLERRVFLRYDFKSGQSSIHGQTLFEVQTQEAQKFSFHSGTGQGSEGEGPGTGKAILYTPGCQKSFHERLPKLRVPRCR